MNANNNTTGNGYGHKGETLDVVALAKRNTTLQNPQDSYRRQK